MAVRYFEVILLAAVRGSTRYQPRWRCQMIRPWCGVSGCHLSRLAMIRIWSNSRTGLSLYAEGARRAWVSRWAVAGRSAQPLAECSALVALTIAANVRDRLPKEYPANDSVVGEWSYTKRHMARQVPDEVLA